MQSRSSAQRILEVLLRISEKVEEMASVLCSDGAGAPLSDHQLPVGVSAPLTVKEAAARSGFSYSTIIRAIRSGALKAYSPNQRAARPAYRVRPEDLAAWIEANEGAKSTPSFTGSGRRKVRSRHFDLGG
jgi:excisionase family DNA binding protein